MDQTKETVRCVCSGATTGISSGVYGMAFIGALVYYLQNAETFAAAALGALKALVWPSVLIYHVLQFLNM